jgi:hypothetical protein
VAAWLAMVTPFALAQDGPTPGAHEPHRYQWTDERTDGPCKSYSSLVAGKDYIAAKAVCDVPARLEVINTLLRDIDGFPGWLADCQATRVLKVEQQAPDSLVFWLHQHVPLFQDRDMVLRATVTIDYAKGINLIEVRSTADLPYDAGQNLVRAPAFYAQFRLEWIDRDHTRVTYLLDPDLGPGLPTSLANGNLRTLPLRSMEGLLKKVNDGKYRAAARDSHYARWVDQAIKQGYLK